MPRNEMITCPHCDRAGEVEEEVEDYDWGREYCFFCKKCLGGWFEILEYFGDE